MMFPPTLTTAIIHVLLHAIEEAPALFEDARKVFEQLGSEDGGIARLSRAAAAFSVMAVHASNSATGAVQATTAGAVSEAQRAEATVRAPVDTPPPGPVEISATAPPVEVSTSSASVVTSGGSATDAAGNPILNAADQFLADQASLSSGGAVSS